MGQKVHPIGFRIGITKDHSSFWYSKTRNYLSLVKEDIFIRKYISDKLFDSGVSNIEIKRKLNIINVNVFVAKPSVIIGVSGNKLFELRNNLSSLLTKQFTFRDLTVNIIEIANPDTNPRILAEFMRQQLEKRLPFRRVIKSAIARAQKAGVKGIKVQISGRLNGAEIARTEWVREGQVPLHTLKANIDYCSYKAQTLYGILGIKVWVYNV